MSLLKLLPFLSTLITFLFAAAVIYRYQFRGRARSICSFANEAWLMHSQLFFCLFRCYPSLVC